MPQRKIKYFLTFPPFCIIIVTVLGGIAQLGECLTGSQEVTGSSPVISTINAILVHLPESHFFFKNRINTGFSAALPLSVC